MNINSEIESEGRVGGGVGLSVLSLWLVPWWIQVLSKLASEISLEPTSNLSKHLVYIVFRFMTLLSALFLL